MSTPAAADPIVVWTDPPAARIDLVCIPHGAAGAASFRSWAGLVPDAISLRVVRLPGRESRIGEPPLAHVDDVVAELLGPLRRSGRPLALFGQCSGALIAFELAHALRTRQDTGRLIHLAVAAQSGPSLIDAAHVRAKIPEGDAVSFLRGLGETDAELLGDPDFMELVAPIIAADLQLLETYDYRARPRLNIALTALGGEQDAALAEAELAAWAEETVGDCVVERLPGGHLMSEAQEQLSRVVVDRALGSLAVAPAAPAR